MTPSFAAALQAAERFAGREPRRIGPEHRTFCPFHETPGESDPSLDIREGKDGRALVQCRSKGCKPEDIFEAWGITTKNGRPVRARYVYRNPDGSEFAVKLRFDDDRQPKMIWDRKLGGNEAPLYRLDSINKARENGSVIAIVEGEKDAETLLSLGVPAVCSPHGATEGEAGRKWRKTYTEALAGLHALIFPDNDSPGLAFAEHVASDLAAAGITVQLIPPFAGPKGFDVSDWIAAGHTKAELFEIVSRTPTFQAPQPEKAAPAVPLASHPELVRLSDVQPETISWLWKDRIPRGKLTLLDGDPGLGKSTLSLNIAAAVSTGASLPDGDRMEPADVVILSAEDGAADTIRPRVDAAQGDARRIHLLTSIQTAGGEEETPDLGNHVPMIRLAVDRTRAALVIIDPLMAYLGPDTNSHRDQDVRRTLAPLSRMAEETGCAVLVVRHLNKTNGGPALYRGGGSIGISGAARVALLVAKDPEDDERRVLAVVKNNLAPHAPALGFQLASVGHVARVEWDGEPANYTADELLAVSFQDPEEKTAKESAADFLRALLANGPVPAKQVKKDAAENGLSWKTMCRAKKELEIVSEKKGYAKDTEWTWRLPAWQGVTSIRDEATGGGRSPEDGQKTSKVPTQKNDHLRDSLAIFEGARLPGRGVTSDDFEPEEEAV